MARSEAYRDVVVVRAGGACEYCRLIQAASGVTFHLDHIVPRSQGGPTELSNLALSCPGCNLGKAEQTSALDGGGAIQPLFNPRDYEPWLLGWLLHFAIDQRTGLVVPRSVVAEATIRALNINDSIRVYARLLPAQAGLLA
jgi:hypothetical protein